MNAVAQEIPTIPPTVITLPFEFNWQQPDYNAVFAWRSQKLLKLRRHPQHLLGLRKWYATHPAQFIIDWGCTYDPRNIERGLPAIIPFLLFPKQIEWIDWALERWRASEPGLTEKSRDCGVSWLAMALSVHQCIYRQGMAIGVGSAKADKVDRSDDPDCLFFKARFFTEQLPVEFRGSWEESQHSAYMRMGWPHMGSSITGEAGDNIGRGGRKSMYFVDEAAHLERPQLVESSLLSNTNCRIDISSVGGMNNPFAQKRHQGRVKYFTFHWRDDPRKGQAWYDTLAARTDPVSLAQDVDINYMASSERQLIPGEWIQSAIGAAQKLGIRPTGIRRGALDVADEGNATNAWAERYGIELQGLQQWSGKGSDIYSTVQRAFELCDESGLDNFVYDADGVGSGVRGDARVINERRTEVRGKDAHITDSAFHGGSAVDDPTGQIVEDDNQTNEDMFLNLKAQSWWSLRLRFQNTWRAIDAFDRGDEMMLSDVDMEHLISIDPDLPLLSQLMTELVRPQYKRSTNGKLQVDKSPEGAASPNLADTVMMAFSPFMSITEVWGKL